MIIDAKNPACPLFLFCYSHIWIFSKRFPLCGHRDLLYFVSTHGVISFAQNFLNPLNSLLRLLHNLFCQSLEIFTCGWVYIHSTLLSFGQEV